MNEPQSGIKRTLMQDKTRRIIVVADEYHVDYDKTS